MTLWHKVIQLLHEGRQVQFEEEDGDIVVTVGVGEDFSACQRRSLGAVTRADQPDVVLCGMLDEATKEFVYLCEK